MKKKIVYLLFLCTSLLKAQEYFPKNDGVKTKSHTTIAFTNATIYKTANDIVTKGTLLIKDGKILSVGTSVSIPKEAQIIDLKGKTVYPSFIDLYSDFGISKPVKKKSNRNSPQYDSERKGYYWNDHIRPETNPISDFIFDSKKSKELLKAGFGVVNTHLQDGIIRGNGILVALNPDTSNAYRILADRSGQYLSFSKSKKSNQLYPGSLMGAMALLRQTYIDAKWYANGKIENKDLALEALNRNTNLVQIFDAGSKQNAFRADKIGDEFGIQYTIVGGGDEFENIAKIKATNARYIIPINFRKAYDASNPYLTAHISLADMRKWNQEPSNLKVLAENGVKFSLTTHKLKSVADFQKNLRKAIKSGFDKTKALAALTTVPANILGKNNIGNLNTGSIANFLITSGDIFNEQTTLYENWVQGVKNTINTMNIKDISGEYVLNVNNTTYDLSIKGKGAKQKASLKAGDKKIKSKFSFADGWMLMSINNSDNPKQFTRLTANITKDVDILQGKAIDEFGNESVWTATKKAANSKENTASTKKSSSSTPTLLPIIYPNIGFGLSEKPVQETLLFKNVTVWTSEKDGVLKHTDVLIKNGKIAKIGKGLKANNAKIIDGTNKHLTSGIIDEHSHIAAASINEWAQNSSAEVSIEDVLDPEDINIYRNLAGGVTSIQILHGSANPIGGRSAIIKLKWGEDSEDMIYTDSPKFIKFALGENVKQSRSQNGVRFPQTRMGVEQLFIDYFTRAKAYDQLKKSGKTYRKDLELETLAEILNKERFISCHSYVQSEINMLMKVAEKFDFNINTFTHILEGYKVADKMKKHGVGGSTFSDWWAYKYEVNDAIPYNAAIMHNQGITVAINSDDAEMSRRLNQEAAKSVKYGNLSEEDAWKMVTINPAKLLHLDHRVGSIKVGKDADLVLWSDHPLSIYAKAEKTIIEGRTYFDIAKDKAKRAAIKTERNMLLNMMLHEKINGNKVQQPTKKEKKHFHCDTLH